MSESLITIAPWIAEQTKNLFSRKGHAWLLEGPSGLGQYELGLELAKAWLCIQPQAQQGCNKCTNCHLIDVRAQPDLYVLMPEVQMLDLGWPLNEKAQKEIDDKDRKPSKEIRVEAVRDMVEFTQRTASSSQDKIVLIYPAEKLNLYASNMILKTLEEPAGSTRFIVSSEAAHQLLPTIRSRCQTHTMIWPNDLDSLKWLEASGLELKEANVLLKASGGRPNDARELAELGIDSNLWNSIPKAIQRGDSSVLSGFSPKEVISILQKLCSDLIATYFQFETRYFNHSILPKSKNLHSLVKLFKELGLEARTSEHPFNSGLMIESLCIQANKAMQD